MLNKTTKWEDKSPFISDLAMPINEDNRESLAVQGTAAEPPGSPQGPHTPTVGAGTATSSSGGDRSSS